MPAPINPVLDDLLEPKSGMIDPERLAAMLDLTVVEIANLVGAHRTTLKRNRAALDVQSQLAPIATILSRATGMSGSVPEAARWLQHQPIAAFGNKSAAD